MGKGIFGCLLAFLLAACPPPPPTPPPPVPVEVKPAPPPMVPDARLRLPFFTAVIHVDKAFTEEERAHVRNATTAWSLFSMGQSKLLAVDDMDFDSGIGVDDVHRILKITENNPLVDSVDAQHPGYKVLAFTRRPYNPWAARTIYVISDRVEAPDFMWVVTHEMGHLLGLEDLPDTGSVMSGTGRFRLNWFTPDDLRECQATGACK